MTTAYLCPGCRLNALRRFRIYRRIGPASRATFVSLYGKKPAALRDESASPPPPIAGVSDDAPRTQWPSDVRTEADIVPDIDVNGNSTDRVLEMMRTLAQNGPLRTRYSRTVLPGPVPASEPAHKSTADHKKANIRYYVARDENHHSGNVTPTRQTSISQLVHAPGPAQKSTVDHPVDNVKVQSITRGSRHSDHHYGTGYPQDPGDITTVDNGFIQEKAIGPREKEQNQQRPRLGMRKTRAAHAVELCRLVEDTHRFHDAWRYFQRHYSHPECVAIRSPALQDVPLLRSGRPFIYLAVGMANAWVKDLLQRTTELTPTKFIESLHNLGLISDAGTFWGIVMWRVAMAIQDNAVRQGLRSNDELLTELMSLWKTLFQTYGKRQSTDGSRPPSETTGTWPYLPSGPDAIADFRRLRNIHRESHDTSFISGFLTHLPYYQYPGSSQLGRSAIVTYTIITQQAETFGFSKSVLQDAMPFAVFVSRILYLTDPRTHFETYIMESMLRSSVEKKQIASFMECMAKGERDSMFVHFTNGANVSLDTEQISLDDLAAIEKFLGDQLELCVLHSSLPSAIALWEQAVAIAQSHTLQKRGMRFSGELYNDFMSAFMKLKRPEQAVLVWNTLNTHGFNPTVKMWTSMLEGFMRLGDVEATEQVWDRMLLSGTKPDSCAWTARLLALFHRSYGEGMQALKHFGETWIEALRKAGNEKDAEQVATRPTTRLLNRLITRFYRKGTRYADVMTDLLVWGKDHGVKPDIVTMNMLLGKSLKLDNSEEASNVFNLMQEQGIKPDPATYAIIIDSIFRDELIAPNFEAQMERVGAVLKEAEEQGLDVAEQTYTAIINGLIKSYGNIDAAKAVLNFMISKGAQPHIYVFTIIATHLFEQDPPDVVGLDLLYTQVRKLHVTKRVQPDVIFYDRMIEGYAKIGQIGKAMTFLAKMSPKHCPGWRALAAVAQALANAGDWSRLDGLLQDVQGEAREKFGEKKFWDKVAQIEASRPSPRPGVAAAQPGMAAAQTG